MTEQSIKDNLPKSDFISYIQYYDEIDSTNKAVMAIADDGVDGNILAISDMQTDGRGRLGRSFFSPSGYSIYMSLCIRSDCDIEHISMLTLVSAIAISSAIEDETGINISIKWPNDIIYQRKKICGILTELKKDKKGQICIIIGIGINANNDTFPDDISDKAISIKQIIGRNIDRSHLIGKIIREFEIYYDIFMKTKDMSTLRYEYEEKLTGIGKEVTAISKDRDIIGIEEGIDDNGNLVMRLADGNIYIVNSGEISIRNRETYN